MNKFFALSVKQINSITTLLARIVLGTVLFLHGAQKLLGWFDGHGYQASMGYFSKTLGLPVIVGFSVILIEFSMPVLLVLGFLTRLSALLIFFLMIGIIITVQHDHFFMNWFGTQQGEGMEFFILAIGLSLVCLLSGSGKYGLDYYLNIERNEN
jgi:putative oxidoreductase